MMAPGPEAKRPPHILLLMIRPPKARLMTDQPTPSTAKRAAP